MWLQFPAGCTRISIEQQTFEAEQMDDVGNVYGRVPDHFVPKIMAVGKFKAISEPPENFPADLPKSDPIRDGAIASMTQENQRMKEDIGNLTSDLLASNAQVRSLMTENESLRKQVEMHTQRFEAVTDYLEDKDIKLPEHLSGEKPADEAKAAPKGTQGAKK